MKQKGNHNDVNEKRVQPYLIKLSLDHSVAYRHTGSSKLTVVFYGSDVSLRQQVMDFVISVLTA